VMPAWVAWIWAVGVGMVQPFGEPKFSWWGAATLGSTIWLASPWGRAGLAIALSPLPRIARAAVPIIHAEYAAAFARFYPNATKITWRVRASRAVRLIFNPYTALATLAVGGTIAQVNLTVKHGAGVYGSGSFGAAPSLHLKGGKPWWDA